MSTPGVERGEAAITAVKDFLARYRIPFEVIEDPKQTTAPVTILERLSGKSVSFAWGQVLESELARNAETGSLYLRVALDDGRRLGFAAIGVVFAPSFVSTGPVPDCPATACWADYRRLFAHLAHVSEEDHEEHRGEALQVLMVLLAFLEGARLAGFVVDEEERELQAILEKLEAQGRVR